MRFFILFVTLCTLIGCNGSHCITLGGTYEKISGDVKYCWDNTSESKRPILTDENGNAAVLMSEEDMQKIATKLEIFTAPKSQSLSTQSAILSDHVNAILDKLYP